MTVRDSYNRRKLSYTEDYSFAARKFLELRYSDKAENHEILDYIEEREVPLSKFQEVTDLAREVLEDRKDLEEGRSEMSRLLEEQK